MTDPTEPPCDGDAGRLADDILEIIALNWRDLEDGYIGGPREKFAEAIQAVIDSRDTALREAHEKIAHFRTDLRTAVAERNTAEAALREARERADMRRNDWLVATAERDEAREECKRLRQTLVEITGLGDWALARTQPATASPLKTMLEAVVEEARDWPEWRKREIATEAQKTPLASPARDPELTVLIAQAQAAYAAMPPEQRAAHDIAQRESFGRGNVEIDQQEREERRTVKCAAQTSAGDVERALE